MAARVQPVLTFPRFMLSRLMHGIEAIGEQITFYVRTLIDCFLVVPRHPGEVLRIISEITWGSGALIVGAGTAGVIFFMAFITGGLVGLEGFKGLELIGAQGFSGFVPGLGNTGEITPIMPGVSLAAQVGASFRPGLGRLR